MTHICLCLTSALITKYTIGFFIPTDLTVGYDLDKLKTFYRTNETYNGARCEPLIAAKLAHDINLRNQASKLRKQAQDKRRDTDFNTAFAKFMKEYLENDSETQEEFVMQEEPLQSYS